MDRVSIDFERLARLNDASSFFVSRAKSNFRAKRRYSRAVDRATGLVCDQIVVLSGFYSREGYKAPLRPIKFNDPETGKRLVFLTKNFALPALGYTGYAGVSNGVKQDLRIKAFFGTTENAVKTHSIARSVTLLAFAFNAATTLSSAPANAYGTRHAFCIQGDEYPGFSTCTFDSYTQWPGISFGTQPRLHRQSLFCQRERRSLCVSRRANRSRTSRAAMQRIAHARM